MVPNGVRLRAATTTVTVIFFSDNAYTRKTENATQHVNVSAELVEESNHEPDAITMGRRLTIVNGTTVVRHL